MNYTIIYENYVFFFFQKLILYFFKFNYFFVIQYSLLLTFLFIFFNIIYKYILNCIKKKKNLLWKMKKIINIFPE